MKPIYRKISTSALLILSIVSFNGCKKNFLEVEPKGKLIAKTVSDYSLLLNNLDLLNVGTNAQIPMGDELASVDPYFSSSALRTQRLFRWEDVVYQPTDDSPELVTPMLNIYLYNKIITEVPNATEGTAQEKASIKAEALAGRAWTYFLLINYYGKPYQATSSAQDPGFPIVTRADVTDTQFSRASVQEVYDFILNDLTTAIPDLPKQTTSRLRMGRAAAEGLLGKVYVFMGRYNDALIQLNAAISDAGNGVLPINLYNYNVTFGTGGSFLPITTRSAAFPSVPNNQEILYGKQAPSSWQYSGNELVLNPKAVALYGANDVRFRLLNGSAYNGAAYPAGLLRRGAASNAQIGVMMADLYLLRAECKARTGDLNGAKADLEFFRGKRMPAANAVVPAAIAGVPLSLIQFVLDERIREYAAQGYRWFDMRRLSVDPLFANTTYTHTLYKADGSTQTFTLKPERLVLRFPQKILDQNPGMQNNP